MPQLVNIVGKRYGRLTVVGRRQRVKGTRGHVEWECLCDCGETCFVHTGTLNAGKQVSCGCYGRERVGESVRTHGKCGTPEYSVWSHMLDRCKSKNPSVHKKYGARGITVCKRWVGKKGFQNFLADMGERPSAEHQIDRKKNNLGYSPSNCRWVTRTQNMRNTRANKIITYKDETEPVSYFAEKHKIKPATLYRRLEKGMDAAAAIETPLRTWPGKCHLLV